MGKNTQANVTYSNEVFKQYVLKLSTNLVWKNQALANASESSDVYDRYRSEIFLLANQGRLVFSVVRSFPRVVLQNVFGASEDLIERYASDKNMIPVNERDLVVTEYQNALRSKNTDTGNYAYWDTTTSKWVEIYHEPNNYYRMLMGLPDTDDFESVTLNDDVLVKYIVGYDELPEQEKQIYRDTPIQDFSTSMKYALESDGIVATLLEENPTKKYLEYIGVKKIDIYASRSAEKFALLWRDNCDSDTLNDAWDQYYEASRRLMVSVYYSNAFRRDNALYDNFLAMAILFVTIHQMQTVYLKADFTRDFYDLESLKIVYDSYGVPFYSEMPIKYHRRVVKNINRLISNKGSDTVFFDLFDIFDMGTMELYNYFFVKKQIVDENENPIFKVRYEPGYEGCFIIDDESNVPIGLSDTDEVKIYPWYETGVPMFDSNGRVLMDTDAFEWFFSKVPIGADPSMAVTDSSTYVSYESITGPDPYWVEDEYLEEAKSKTNVNFIESKYLSINTVIDMMKIVYESSYLFRMILDNYKDTSSIYTNWTDTGLTISLFDLIIYTCLLISRISGYEETIDSRIPAVAESLGFDYEHLTSIISSAGSNQYTGRNNPSNDAIYAILDSLTSGQFNGGRLQNTDSVETDYNNIMKLRDMIAEKLTTATSIQEFEAFRQLYYSLMYSYDVTETYVDPEDVSAVLVDTASLLPFESGEDSNPSGIGMRIEDDVFSDFSSLLEYYNPQLLQRFLLLDDESDNLERELELVNNELQDMLDMMQYTPIALSTKSEDSSTMTNLVKILQFFKSAKAELFDFSITFVIRDRLNNLFRQMDRVMKSELSERSIGRDTRIYVDFIERVDDNQKFANNLLYEDVLYEHGAPVV